MSLMINQNITSLNAWRNLNKTDRSMSATMEKLSSGLRINKAADNPSGLVISEQMRAQVAGLKAAITNSEKGVSMIQTAEGALDKVHSLLDKMRGLALDSANSATADAKMLAANQAEVTNILETISRIASNTQYGTKKLLDGSNALQTTFDSRANGVGSVVSADAADGAYAIAVGVKTAGSVTAGTTLTDMGLAYVGGDSSPVSSSLSTGTHTLSFTGALETLAKGATETLASGIQVVGTNPTGATYLSGTLATAGAHTVTFSGATADSVNTATLGGGNTGTIAVDLAAGTEKFVGTGASLVVAVAAGGNGVNLATTNVASGGLTVATDGGGAVAAAWNFTTRTLSWGTNSITFNNAAAVSGAGVTGDTVTLAVTASNLGIKLDTGSNVALYSDFASQIDLTVANGADNVHLNLAAAALSDFTGGDVINLAKFTGTAATVTTTLGASSYYSGTAGASYKVELANNKLDSALVAGDFVLKNATTGATVSGVTFTNNAGTWTAAGSDFNFQFTVGAGYHKAADAFTVDLGASAAKLVVDGNTVGGGAFHSTSTTATATGAANDSVTLDVSGVTTANLSASGTIAVVQTAYQARLSSASGGAGSWVDVTAGQNRVDLADGATTNNGGPNTLKVNFGTTLVAGTSNVSLEDKSLVFQIGANQDQTVKIGVQDISAASLAVKANADADSDLAGISSNFASLADIDVTTAKGAQDAIVMIDAAIDQVSTIRGNLGAFQANTLEANLDTLRVSSENLQASESTIRDADMAAEMAQFTKYQIMMQAGTAMLAQANQAPNNLLTLLRG
ncbi:MAG: hypothetical protein HZB55_13615 [Deltaproteobacteria bacterium]|nr:hypothetical protein [Deltaproteobacteria bacterium]